MKLKKLCKRISYRLGIKPLQIKFEEISDDSRLYIKEKYVAINKKYENNYVETAKCIAHEYRHVFQIFYVQIFSDERSLRWKKELQSMNNSSNIGESGLNYLSQEIELDAFAFTKFYLENFENIKVKNRIAGFDQYIDIYIENAKSIM